MRIIRRWHEHVFNLYGEPLRLKLKALSFEEAPEFVAAMDKARQGAHEAESTLQTVVAGLPEGFARNAFEHYVRLTEPLEDEHGMAISSGAELYGWANYGLVFSVLWAISMLAIQSSFEGKDSPSPSTSDSGLTEPASGSAATRTESEGGAPPSTAPEIHDVPA